MSVKAYVKIEGNEISVDDLSFIMEMREAAVKMKAASDKLSFGATSYLYGLHSEDTELCYLARWAEENTTEVTEALSKEFATQGVAMPSRDDAAMALREQAKDLLAQANAIDNMAPVIVTHSHEYGSSGYILWVNDTDDLYADEENGCQKIIEALNLNFDENKESLMIETDVGISEMTGSNPGGVLRYVAQPVATTRKPRPA
jgi:hypothetical protein